MIPNTLFALIATIASTFALPPPEIENWRLSHPAFTGARLNSVAWGDEGCVAVGNNGLLLHSTDGSQWSNGILGSPPKAHDHWNDVCHGAGRFVVVGGGYADGRIASSTDGINWDVRLTGNGNTFRSVTYGDGRFVAIADTDVFISTDGTIWTRNADSPGLSCLAFGNGIWIGAASNGRTYLSADLSAWSSTSNGWIPVTYHQQEGIAFGNGRFVIAGGYPTNHSSTSASVLKWSVDGSTWLTGSSDDSETIWGVKSDCVFANGLFVAVGSLGQDMGFRDIYRSPDGESWTRSTAMLPHTVRGSLTGVAGAEGRPFVAVSTAGEILISEDATTWTPVDTSAREYLQALAHANGRYVALAGQGGSIGGPPGTGLLLTSADGRNWVSAGPDPADCPRSIAHGNGCWIVTGDNGLILRSLDGIAWEDRSIAGTSNDLHLATYHAGRFIAFSKFRDRIYHSEYGLDWKILDDTPVSGISDVAVFDGRLVGAGSDGAVFSSVDGLTWTKTIIHPTVDFTGVCVGKGRIVLSAYDAGAFSENGSDFTIIESHDDDRILPTRVIYLDGWFVGDNMEVSRDGIHWQSSGPSGYMPAYGRFERMISVGNNLLTTEGLEIRSATFITETPQLIVIPGVGIDFLTEDGKEYRAHHSTDLADWYASESWHPGSGDYVIQGYGDFPVRLFWKIESRNLPTVISSD